MVGSDGSAVIMVLNFASVCGSEVASTLINNWGGSSDVLVGVDLETIHSPSDNLSMVIGTSSMVVSERSVAEGQEAFR